MLKILYSILKIPYSILKIPYVYFEYLENTVFGNRRRANAARSRVRRAQRHLLTGSRDAARHLRGDLGAGRRRAQTLLLRGRLPAQTPFLHGPWPAQGPFRQPLRLRIFLRRMPAGRIGVGREDRRLAPMLALTQLSNYSVSNFEGLVLGCIEAKFCK